MGGGIRLCKDFSSLNCQSNPTHVTVFTPLCVRLLSCNHADSVRLLLFIACFGVVPYDVGTNFSTQPGHIILHALVLWL